MSRPNQSMNHGRSGAQARWLLLLLFPVGYFITLPYVDQYPLVHLAATCASAFACCVLLLPLRQPLRSTLPLWLLFTVFMTYYAQLYWITADSEALRGWWLPDLYSITNSTSIRDAYVTITIGFVTFAVTGGLLLANSADHADGSRRAFQQPDPARVFRTAFITLLIIAPTTGYAMYAGRIGLMGAEAPTLPFHLGGIVFYGRLATLPALLLLMIWSADTLHSKWRFNVAVAATLICGLSDMVLRASRGALVSLLVPASLLLVLTDRLTRSRVVYLLLSVAMIVGLWPIMTLYRISRGTEDPSILISLRQSLDAVTLTDVGNPAGVILDAGRTVLLRITGAVSLIPAVGAQTKPLGIHGIASVTDFFTTEVMGYPPEAIHSSAPSLLGWLFLVGGNVLVVVGVFGLTVGVWMVWRYVQASQLSLAQVAQALVATWLFYTVVDGVLERAYLSAFACALSVFLCEWIARSAGNKSRPGQVNANLSPQVSPVR